MSKDSWKVGTWGDLGVLEYGRALRDYRDVDGPVRVFGTNGPIGWTRASLGKGPAVIIGRKGAYRGVHYSPGPFWVIDTAYWFRPVAALDPRWVYYQLLTQDINGHDSGSAIPSLSRTDFASLKVLVPSLSEQRAIGEVLGALDDKIAANDRARNAADELLSHIFKDMAAPAMNNVSDDEPLPSGWHRERLGNVLDVIETGSRPKGGVAGYATGVPSVGAESILGIARFNFSKIRFVPPDYFAAMRRGVAKDRDVFLYKDGGRPGEFEPHVSLLGNGFPFPEYCINEHVYRLRAAEPLTQEFLYYWLSSEPILEEMRRRGTGVAVPGLNSTSVKELPINVPPLDLVDRFGTLAVPLTTLLLGTAKESRELTILRDAMLPRLLSGDLPVRRAEELAEEAL
ncbi:MAG: restriction endonuclease subunit S [Candidatus Dormibacteria bacterium]